MHSLRDAAVVAWAAVVWLSDAAAASAAAAAQVSTGSCVYISNTDNSTNRILPFQNLLFCIHSPRMNIVLVVLVKKIRSKKLSSSLFTVFSSSATNIISLGQTYKKNSESTLN